jgi:4-hydroxy-tetrahydrodipicolinate reductase
MIRVLHLGLGEIGKATIEALIAQEGHAKVVGAVDIQPALAGKPLREVFGGTRGRALGAAGAVKVAGSIGEALKGAKGKPDVATMTTGSHTEQVKGTLYELIDAGVHVVSTCEELSYPTLRAAKLTAEIDRRAKKAGVVILGTGVNPGFAMDAFALACTAPCTCEKHIKVLRSLDASKRRQQLQKKVGIGQSVAEIKALIRKGAIGHVGLQESVAMIAAGLGWKLDSIKERFEPVVADHLVTSEWYRAEPGQVRGMRMTAAGIVGGKKLIELELTMALDADTFDEVIIDGTPPLLVRTKSGFPGDSSTVGMLVNCARVAPGLEPGVRTMMDVLKVRSVGV